MTKYHTVACLHLLALWYGAWIDEPLMIAAVFVMGQAWLLVGMVVNDFRSEK